MRNAFKKLVRGLKADGMTAREKQAIRLRLERVLQESAVSSPVVAPRSVRSYEWMSFYMNVQRFSRALVLLLAFVGPLAYSAEQALPGNFLYVLKTRINEPIRRAITTSSMNSSAEFEVFLLERRLVEAEQLQYDPVFETTLKQEVAERISEQKAVTEEAFRKSEREQPKQSKAPQAQRTNDEPASAELFMAQPAVAPNMLRSVATEATTTDMAVTPASSVVLDATATLMLSVPDVPQPPALERVLEKHADIISKLKISDKKEKDAVKTVPGLGNLEIGN